ncbi:MAG: hypothetical protein AB7H80_16470 [Candidatus Kapaibacterium sp.]
MRPSRFLLLFALLGFFPAMLVAQNRDFQTERLILDDNGADGTKNVITIRTPNPLSNNLLLTIPDPGLTSAEFVLVPPGTGGVWQLKGNSGTTPGVNYIGTSNPRSLHLYVNGGLSNSLILNTNGSLQLGTQGLARGNQSVDFQYNFAFPGVGAGGSNSMIGSGVMNTITADVSRSSIVTGFFNRISSSNDALIGSGLTNSILESSNVFLGSGLTNSISKVSASGIVAGVNNRVDSGSSLSIVGAGTGNVLFDSPVSGIVAGTSNSLSSSTGSTVSGGTANEIANATNGFIGGGTGNQVQGQNNGVLGGSSNWVGGTNSTVLGGGSLLLAGSNTIAFNGGGPFLQVLLSNSAVFANADLYLANNSGTPSRLLLYEASGGGFFPPFFPTPPPNYTAFVAGNQASDITYVLPTAPPVAGQVLSASAVAGSTITLAWANDATVAGREQDDLPTAIATPNNLEERVATLTQIVAELQAEVRRLRGELGGGEGLDGERDGNGELGVKN